MLSETWFPSASDLLLNQHDYYILLNKNSLISSHWEVVTFLSEVYNSIHMILIFHLQYWERNKFTQRKSIQIDINYLIFIDNFAQILDSIITTTDEADIPRDFIINLQKINKKSTYCSSSVYANYVSISSINICCILNHV